MRLACVNRLAGFGAVLGALSCGGGGGGGTSPPGPPTDLTKSGGDAQSWYFNNPLPTLLSVTAHDASGRAVPGVVVTWAVTSPSGSGAVSPTQSTTNASGVATTTDSVGTSTIQTVSATFNGLPGPVSFTENAQGPPTSGAVDVGDQFFRPSSLVVQVGGTVTWTWIGTEPHSVTFNGGADSGTKTAGTFPQTFANPGTFTYHCVVHGNMSGTVTVVH